MFNESLLVVLTEEPSLLVYDFRADEVLCQIPLEKTFTYTGLLHPPTYENNVMVKTPHLHVVGVGSEDGTFRLINLKKDEILLKLNHAKPITALDCQTERPIVACGLSDGSVSVWDLEEMSLITQISAHTS